MGIMSSPPWTSSSTSFVVMGAATLSCMVVLMRFRLRRPTENVDQVEEEELDVQGNDKAQREVSKKLKLVARAQSKSSSVTGKWQSGDVPPGNFKTTSWLQTDLSLPLKSKHYSLEEDKYRLTIRCGDRQVVLTLEELQSLGMKQFDKVDWHCVTGWSYLGFSLYGVPLKRLLSVLGPDLGGDDWQWLFQLCADGYTCPVFRDDALRDEVFMAIRDDSGSLIPAKHGGPRLVFPSLWGWKSAKFMTEIRLMKEYVPGFWEKLMCHQRGRIFDEDGNYLEERWSPAGKRTGFHDLATTIVNFYHYLFGARFYGWTMYVGGYLLGLVAKPLLRFDQHDPID